MTLKILFILIAWASDCNQQTSDPGAQAAFKVFGFHIYDINYKPQKGYPEGQYSLELSYKKTISKDRILSATEDEIKKAGFDEKKIKNWIEALKPIIPDVKPGDSLIGYVDEKKQSRFCLAGKSLGTIQDPEFADAFFGIWLSEKTSRPSLRETLLKAKPPAAL